MIELNLKNVIVISLLGLYISWGFLFSAIFCEWISNYLYKKNIMKHTIEIASIVILCALIFFLLGTFIFRKIFKLW